MPIQVVKIQELLQKYQHNSILSVRTVSFAHNLRFFKTIYSLTNPIHCKSDDIITFNLTKLSDVIGNVTKYIDAS